MEQSGHIEGMLDRDQRTAKLRFFDNSTSTSTERTYSFQERKASDVASPVGRHCCHPGRTKRDGASTTTSLPSSRRKAHLLNTVQSLKNLLAVVSIIALALLPIVHSAPIGMDQMPPEKWLDPCDAIEKFNGNENLTPSEISTTELKKVALQAEAAQKQAKTTMDEYISRILKDTTTTETLKGQKINWLPSMPEPDLENLNLDEVLSDTYTYLQRAAVGLDLAVLNRDPGEKLLLEEFKEAENQLKRVLCELWHIIVESNRSLPPDVHRDIVSDSDKAMDQGYRIMRNYIILRNYTETLSYINKVFSHLGG